MTKEEKIIRIESKYKVKVIELCIENNYIKVEDNEGYQYELNYTELSRFKKSSYSLTKESYIKKYINDNKINTSKFNILNLKNDRVEILNKETNVSVWQPKYNFNEDRVLSLTEGHLKYINIVKNRLGDKYDYSKLEYTGTKNDAILICPDHGEFRVNWSNLIYKDHQGCKLCTYTQRRFGRIGFIENCNRLETDGLLYFIKLYNDYEKFYKIGITSNVNNRFNNFPYQVEKIYIFKGDPGDVYDLEKFLHKKFSSDLHIPNIKFNGYMECFKFNDELKVSKIILELSKKLLKLLPN